MEDKNQQTLNDILDTVVFIKDNAVSKSEFNELKEEVNGLKSEVSGVKSEIVGIKSEVSSLKSEVSGLKSEVSGLSGRVGRIESQMVTKAYLDDKLADLRGDLVVLMRKEDTKLKELVEILKNKNILNNEDVKQIMSMEPFPQSI